MKKPLFITILFLLSLTCSVFAEIKGDTIEYEIQGKLTFKSGAVVKMQQLSGEEIPMGGIEGELSKSFETELFGGKMTGWVVIGDMKVVSVNKDIVTFSLLKELSVVTENGVKKNQFEIGREVKFVWKVAVTADEAEFKKGQAVIDSNLQKALIHYKKAVALNPKHDKALNMTGMVMSEQGILDSALYYFKKAFEVNPRNAQYAKNICITSFKTGLLNDGYDFANKAVDCDNSDPEAWYLRSLMHYFLKKDTLADIDKQSILADADKSVQLTPDDSFYYGERAFLRKAFGDITGACEDAKKAKELGAENSDDLMKKYCP